MFVATGITITFASGFIAEFLDVSGPGLSRESIDITHQGSVNAREFTPARLYDGGEVSIEMGYDPAANVPINEDPEDITITWPDDEGTAITFKGFLTKFEPSGTLEDKATASATLKVTGEVSNVGEES